MSTVATWVSTIGLGIYFASVLLLLGFYLVNMVRSTLRKRSLVRCKQHLPCDHCVYFTGETLLTCAVNPRAALTNDALNCRDFEVRE
jgi:hypothetical protein